MSDFMEQDEEAEIGIIESVHLKNFMCHDNYKIEFCPNVNIILGKNGSGKSSIISAIQVAFGGKATASGKALLLKNTVQKGKQIAEVAVSIRNRGCDAFRADIYGEKITVERRITVEGMSSYKLKDSSGKVVSTKKEDLNAILSAFNIQVNNPIAILTQEMSKTFLQTKDPKEKYNLFLQSTQLHELEKTYKACQDQLENVHLLLECKEQNLLDVKHKVEDLERQMNDVSEFEKYKEERDALRKESFWSGVTELEELLSRLHVLMKRKKDEVEVEENVLKAIKEQYDKAVQEEDERNKDANKLQMELNLLSVQHNKQCSQRKEIQNNIRETRAHLSSCARDIESKEVELENMKTRITDLKSWCAENSKMEKLHNAKKIAECRKRIEAEIQNRTIFEHKLISKRNDLMRNEQERTTKNEERHVLDLNIVATEKEIGKLELCKSNHMLAFGRKIPELLGRIQDAVNRNIFHKKPIGPLGLYVKVNERRWSLAIECCLGANLLKSFLCDNLHDQEQLLEIMQDVFPNQSTPQVITSKFISMVHDVSSRRVFSNEYACVLDMINDTDPVVLNCLIDERGIENILLIPIAATARNIMMHTPPQKCNEVFTIKGNSVFPYPNFRFYCSRKRNASMISVAANLNENIITKIDDLKHFKMSNSQSEVEINTLCSQRSDIENAIKELQASVTQINTFINKESVEIQELESTEVPDTAGSLDVEFNQLKTYLEDLKKKNINLEEELVDQQNQLKSLDDELKYTGSKHSEKRNELDKAVKAQVSQSSRGSNRIFQRQQVHIKKYEKNKGELKNIDDAIQKETPVLKKHLEAAENFHPRINTPRSTLIVGAQLSVVSDRISGIEANFPNIDDISEEYNKRKAEHESTECAIENLQCARRKLEERMQWRLKAFENILPFVCARVNYLFTINLHSQQYFGRLLFDHGNRTLNVKARIRVGKSSDNTRSLSGGEKSYVTVVFLLAMWDAVDLPFRIMDEYDVYMDQLNRKKSMDLMISTALGRSFNQFIFFSPQLLTTMRRSNKIQIIQLPDPDRKSPQKRRRH